MTNIIALAFIALYATNALWMISRIGKEPKREPVTARQGVISVIVSTTFACGIAYLAGWFA